MRGPLLTVPPADAVALALGIAGETAADLAAAAADPEPALARAANQALWPATWGSWLTDPMSIDGAPMIDHDLIGELREWFVGNVRADGPLPTLHVGRQPYGLLPVAARERHDGGGLFEHLENFLLDLLDNWTNLDAVPLLDPDSTDVPPDDTVEEQASDVGEVYGATPHIRELRLRPVDDRSRADRPLRPAAGLRRAAVRAGPGRHGDYHPRGASPQRWYSIFLESRGRGPRERGAAGQIDALRSMVDDIDSAGGTPQQEAAELAIRTYLNRLPADSDGPTTRSPATCSASSAATARRGPTRSPTWRRSARSTSSAPTRRRACTPARYGEEGTEPDVGVLVAPGRRRRGLDLAGWLETRPVASPPGKGPATARAQPGGPGAAAAPAAPDSARFGRPRPGRRRPADGLARLHDLSTPTAPRPSPCSSG